MVKITKLLSPSHMTSTEKIEEMVRDFCSVVPKSKSEVRQRIHQAIAEERERVRGEIEKLRGGTCDCVGGKYNCEHWGRHEFADALLLFLDTNPTSV
ncbi:MAG: hypothetical protein SGJ02_04935 [bacterium]|nr:hypothetical protein [bacterium]